MRTGKRMPVVNVDLGHRSYPVLIGAGLLQNSESWRDFIPGNRILIVSNEVVAPLYLQKIINALGSFQLDHLILPDGENQKTLSNWSVILDRLVSTRAGRDSCLLALGGGVIGDITGFAAAAYMRGIPFIQAPTTLLAQVDASVGGKTAINHPAGKNLIGAFHQPAVVVADVSTLSTLDEREFRAGLAEVVKVGAIGDPEFMQWLEDNAKSILAGETDSLVKVIERSVRYKAEIVAQDELESGNRALLNFGHSFAHAFEAISRYSQLMHGEAVSIGMVIASTLSEARGLCPPGTSNRIKDLLLRFGLPVRVPDDMSAEEILKSMSLDKKNLEGQSRLILLRAIGEAFIDSSSSISEITSALESCR